LGIDGDMSLVESTGRRSVAPELTGDTTRLSATKDGRFDWTTPPLGMDIDQTWITVAFWRIA
jgi:hypothetical protein